MILGLIFPEKNDISTPSFEQRTLQFFKQITHSSKKCGDSLDACVRNSAYFVYPRAAQLAHNSFTVQLSYTKCMIAKIEFFSPRVYDFFWDG